MKIKISTAAALTVFLSLTACGGVGSSDGASTAASSSQQANGASIMGKIALTIKNPDGSLLYSDSVNGSALQLTAGQTYTLNLNIANPQAGATYSLQSTQTNIASGSPISIPVQLGDNRFAIPAQGQGDYSWKFVASAPNMTAVTKYYLASVQCANSGFTTASLNAAAISVTSGTSPNLYNFSAAGVTSGANGQPPYKCAWDITGTGVQDSAFQDCGSDLINAYVNLVGSRNIGLLVKDSCFTTHAIAYTVNLTHTTPAMPGNVFITGVLSNATGTASGDARIDGVNYLATNAGGNNIVQPNYSGGTFTIEALQSYGMPSSVKFGMKIVIKGITDTIDVATGMGTVSAANATIASVIYSTDQAGDQKPAVSLSTTTCTLSNQNAKVKFVSGQPCTAGHSGDNNMATVEVWGHYSCPSLNSAGEAVTIQGDFDGYTDLVDNCSGGGGGGGGIVPINL